MESPKRKKKKNNKIYFHAVYWSLRWCRWCRYILAWVFPILFGYINYTHIYSYIAFLVYKLRVMVWERTHTYIPSSFSLLCQQNVHKYIVARKWRRFLGKFTRKYLELCGFFWRFRLSGLYMSLLYWRYRCINLSIYVILKCFSIC